MSSSRPFCSADQRNSKGAFVVQLILPAEEKISKNYSFVTGREGAMNKTNQRPANEVFGAMTNLELKGNWNEVKGKLKQKYGQLTDDDLSFAAGKEDEAS